MFSDDEKDFESFKSPLMIDQQIQAAAQLCWMMLPEDRRNENELRKELTRIVNRICDNLGEDLKHFSE